MSIKTKTKNGSECGSECENRDSIHETDACKMFIDPKYCKKKMWMNVYVARNNRLLEENGTKQRD